MPPDTAPLGVYGNALGTEATPAATPLEAAVTCVLLLMLLLLLLVMVVVVRVVAVSVRLLGAALLLVLLLVFVVVLVEGGAVSSGPSGSLPVAARWVRKACRPGVWAAAGRSW
jgi:hypothetical protein